MEVPSYRVTKTYKDTTKIRKCVPSQKYILFLCIKPIFIQTGTCVYNLLYIFAKTLNFQSK